MTDFWRLDNGKVCAGILVKDNIVIETPPIFRWMKGKSFSEIYETWQGEITAINQEETVAQFPTIWTVVDQIDNSVNPKTQKGKPQKKIRTDKNQWVIVTGDGAEQIVVGLKIEISEPKPYGKNNTLYATLQSIEISNSMPKPPEPAYGAGPAEQALADARSVVNGAKPSNGKIPWKDFAAFVVQTHTMLREVEPDGFNEGGVTVDRSAARATMFNTCVMALERGQIGTPETLDTEEVPF